MSYSAFFTSGLSLASQPRSESFESLEIPQVSSTSPPQITIQPSTPRSHLRRRRSSLTIATSPMSAVKSPLRSAQEAARTAMRTSSHGSISLLEAMQSPTGTRPKFARRKTVSYTQSLPTFPAPTSPLPPLPSLLANLSRNPSPGLSSPIATTPIDDIYPSSPVSADPVLPSSFGTLRSNPARRSSSALPPSLGGTGRGPFTSSVMGNVEKRSSGDMQMLVEGKDTLMNTLVDMSSAEDLDSMKEN